MHPLHRDDTVGLPTSRLGSNGQSADSLIPEVLKPRVRSLVPKSTLLQPSDAAWTAKANKRVQFGYVLNYMIDTENAVIIDVEATPARTYDEVAATKTMIDRTEEHLGLKPERLAADTAYGTGKFLAWVVGRGSRRIFPSGT